MKHWDNIAYQTIQKAWIHSDFLDVEFDNGDKVKVELRSLYLLLMKII